MIRETCAYCGAEIVVEPGDKHHRLYCGKQCARLAHNQKKRDQDRARRAAAKGEPKQSNLDACMKEAERLGISYGKYMLRRMEG